MKKNLLVAVIVGVATLALGGASQAAELERMHHGPHHGHEGHP